MYKQFENLIENKLEDSKRIEYHRGQIKGRKRNKMLEFNQKCEKEQKWHSKRFFY